MNLAQRQEELQRQFKLGIDTKLENSAVEILFFPFTSIGEKILDTSYGLDYSIPENREFVYPVFKLKKQHKCPGAIFLMHGLNERSWNKYLCWAEYLCMHTGKAVILLPIAFHINRSPLSWINPRLITPILEKRRTILGKEQSQSIANTILSERLSEDPGRFYRSGIQSLCDLTGLVRQIKAGRHPLFLPETGVDFFAYSIGAFLIQIALLSDKEALLKDSRLFVFCGGSVFKQMNGTSRLIMDNATYNKLCDYYLNHFESDNRIDRSSDASLIAFNSMIEKDRSAKERYQFFNEMGNNIQVMALKKDKVMPYDGIVEALGQECAQNHSSLIDFPYEYSHEQPFPLKGSKEQNDLVNFCFNGVFSQAAAFLSK
ncbi:MAG: DUF6051 family protein [Bacteroidales bacterium]|nr:DUF6051 family protein [Bacteroidales bacterium]